MRGIILEALKDKDGHELETLVNDEGIVSVRPLHNPPDPLEIIDTRPVAGFGGPIAVETPNGLVKALTGDVIFTLSDGNKYVLSRVLGLALGLEVPEPPGPAEGATAGTPGTFTPEGSLPPADFAALGSIPASPSVAWAEGEYVSLGDGSSAYWDGATWVVGTAPAALTLSRNKSELDDLS